MMSIVGFAIRAAIFDAAASLGELVDEWSHKADELIKEAERNLAARLKPDSLTALFDFPSHVRGACEQYLLFFVDFLQTLGIESQADLTHESGRALFSVTPSTGKEALKHIKEALDIYLELPLAEGFGNLTLIRDPRVQQLQATVDHLKSQLNFANAVLQLKDATIAQLNVTVRMQTVTPQVLQSSLRAVVSSD
ncbi:MAG: hypothetical protein ABIP85_10090, partial [Chthoniobacteraceae bacterium]